MNPELRLRLVVLLNLIALTFCIVGFFIQDWAEGSPTSQYKDTPIHKDAMKDLDYEHYTSIGILRSCVFTTCISNVADGATIWKILASLGIVSIVCLMASTSFSAIQMCYEFVWVRYLTVASHLVGVVLYTTMLCLFYQAISGATPRTGFFLAVFADALALFAGVASLSGIVRINKVDAIS